jgi:hypothetical protein
MARKAIVDRNTVLQLLKEGKTSQAIGIQFGVSRQAIDLYRKEFFRTGLLQPSTVTPPLPATSPAQQITTEALTKPVSLPVTTREVSLDRMIDLMIKALDAMKRLPELEAEVEKYRREYSNLLQKIEQLEEREKKRLEQEARWIQAQNPENK